MRTLTVHEHLSLDGVVQAPGHRDEDPSGGFGLGGWIEGYADDVLGQALQARMGTDFDLLLGRRTYDIWAPHWGARPEAWPQATRATKYVASRTLTTGSWGPVTILSGDLVGQVARRKREEGKPLHVWGSSELVSLLVQNDLVDTLWLMVYPVVLGTGKRLFPGLPLGKRLVLAGCQTTPKGVVLATYDRTSSPLS